MLSLEILDREEIGSTKSELGIIKLDRTNICDVDSAEIYLVGSAHPTESENYQLNYQLISDSYCPSLS